MKRSLIFAILSISLVGCASSTFTWKNDEGDTFYIEKEDVTCSTEYIKPRSHFHVMGENVTGFNKTNCKANGYTMDLAGKKQRYVGNGPAGKGVTCMHDEFKYQIKWVNTKDPSPRVEEARTGRNPNDVNCAAALYFGKYNPI